MLTYQEAATRLMPSSGLLVGGSGWKNGVGTLYSLPENILAGKFCRVDAMMGWASLQVGHMWQNHPPS